jgi:hypothetical protein
MASSSFLMRLFEALPSPTFLVDDDVGVMLANQAARDLAGAEAPLERRPRGGEFLRCVHAHDHPEGCGRGPRCSDCAVRASVVQALAQRAVAKRLGSVELERDGGVARAEVMVSAAPLDIDDQRLVVLTVEPASTWRTTGLGGRPEAGAGRPGEAEVAKP